MSGVQGVFGGFRTGPGNSEACNEQAQNGKKVGHWRHPETLTPGGVKLKWELTGQGNYRDSRDNSQKLPPLVNVP